MNKDEILKEWEEVIKKEKEETEKWVVSLSDEDFNTLTKNAIIVQAKIHYKQLRDKNKKSD